MEKLRRSRTSSRSKIDVVANARPDERRKRSISRAAENFQNKLIASFKNGKKKAEEGDVEGGSNVLFESFFYLPNELHVQILCELCISDILALRMTSRATNGLVSACSSALVRCWVKYKLGTIHTSLYPPPPPNKAELHYLLAMRRRHIASMRLTRQLANFVLKDTLKHTSERQRQRQIWSSVYDKMIPLVFAVGYFLDRHRQIILERDLGSDQSRIGYDVHTGPAIVAEERDIIRKFDPPLRLQYFYMYCFIVQVLQRKLRPPTYANSVEKFVRGWTAVPACSEDIAFVLVMGGISQVAKLLAYKNYNERRKALDSFVKSLTPSENVFWKENWKELDVESSKVSVDKIPSASIGVTQLDLIWEPLMVEMTSPKSRHFSNSEKMRYEEVKTSRKFINALMGYDILRGRPAEGNDSEIEDGDEM